MTCSLSTCDKPVKRAGYCYGHYMKNWRYGTPEPVFAPRWDDLRGQRFGSLVVTDQRVGRFWICKCDCGATTRADTGNLNRGSKISCGDSKAHHRKDFVSYSGAHERVRNDRGPADRLPCVGCNRPAQHWSYNHDDPDELHEDGLTSRRTVAYSQKPDHYSPRCVTCHKRFDLDRIDAQDVA